MTRAVPATRNVLFTSGQVVVALGCAGGMFGAYLLLLHEGRFALAIGVVLGLIYAGGLYGATAAGRRDRLALAMPVIVGLLSIGGGIATAFSVPGVLFWLAGPAILLGAGLIFLSRLASPLLVGFMAGLVTLFFIFTVSLFVSVVRTFS